MGSTSRQRACSTASRERRARPPRPARAAGRRRRAAGRAAGGGRRRTAHAVAGRARHRRRRRPLHAARSRRASGVDLELLQRPARRSACPTPIPTSRTLNEADLEAARRVKAFLDAGLPEDGMLQVARTIGMGTARVAEANRELIVRTLMQPGDTERDLALRFAAAAEHMLPLVEPTLVYALRAHLLEQIRRDVIGAADLASGEMGGAAEVSVCFADLVGFTKLGEEIAPEELGLVAGRLEEMASAVAEPPVRLVKTDRRRGDAGLDRRRGDDRPRRCAWSRPPRKRARSSRCLRAGIACGPRWPRPATTTAARSTWRAASPASPGPAASSSTRRRGQPARPSTTPSPGAPEGHRGQGEALPRPPRARRLSASGRGSSVRAAQSQAGLRAETSRL